MSVDTKSTSFNWRPWAICCAVLLLGGASYRLGMARFRPLMERRIELPVPLSNFPRQVGDWHGEDRPLTPEVERTARNDDYLNRLYVNRATGEWANLYVAYSGRPRYMVGHRPQVCMRGFGRTVEGGPHPDELALPSGNTIPCLLHRFRKHSDNFTEIVLLNYYVLNGTPTNEESRFVGVGWRLPNIAGDPAYYVAQIQVSSKTESAARELATITAEGILAFLPDREGKVRAAATVSSAEERSLPRGVALRKDDAQTR